MSYENWKHEQQTELLKNHWLSLDNRNMSHTTWIDGSQHPLFDESEMKEINDSQTWDEKEPMFLDEEVRLSSPLLEECHFPAKNQDHEELFVTQNLLQARDEFLRNEADLAFEASLLRTAVEAGNQHSILQLIQQGISVDLPLISSGETALCLAIQTQNVDLIRLLLTHNASPNPPLHDTRHPLHHASSLGNLVIVELLLKHSADIHALSQGHTALDQATTAAIAAVLIDAGMYPKEMDNALLWKAANGGRNARNVLSVVLSEGGYVDVVDREGWTGLRWACSRGDGEIVRVLVEAGARVGEECIGVARENGFGEIVAFLEACGKK